MILKYVFRWILAMCTSQLCQLSCHAAGPADVGYFIDWITWIYITYQYQMTISLCLVSLRYFSCIVSFQLVFQHFWSLVVPNIQTQLHISGWGCIILLIYHLMSVFWYKLNGDKIFLYVCYVYLKFSKLTFTTHITRGVLNNACTGDRPVPVQYNTRTFQRPVKPVYFFTFC